MSVPGELSKIEVGLPLAGARAGSLARALPRARWLVAAGGIAVLLFLVFYNLPHYPVTWFDEGSHLHVPKALVTKGVYADYSSDGWRYFGPTVGVGPTVMLPIAASFLAFGIGLLQARLVIALYLLATIYAYYRLARVFGNRRLAWVATAILVTSQGIALLEYGRQVLGEVPGFFYLVAGLALWLETWERSSWRRLVTVGLLLGLSVVTKNQYLLVIVPAVGLAWLVNLVYWRSAPQRTFIVPGVLSVASYAIWQIYTVVYLGPATALQNLTLLRNATAGAALVFSPSLMKLALQDLLAFKVFLGLLVPVLAYGVTLVIRRDRASQRWGCLYLLIGVNLVWYVVASIGWPRYAFPGLALSALFVAQLFFDLTDGLHFDPLALWQAFRQGDGALPKRALGGVAWAGLAVMILLPAAQYAKVMLRPPFDGPDAMAAYLNQNVPTTAVIETWEPEMGFLTNHNYHYPPTALLNNAVAYIWLNGPAPAKLYDFTQPTLPQYVLIGTFGRWVGLYAGQALAQHYKLLTRIGDYELYQLGSP